jgi:tetratricopeptide (TPR) repeat protein
MQKHRLICSFILLHIFCFTLLEPAHAEGFPGKGDSFAWSAAIPYYNLANKYLEHGRYDEAVQNYEEAIYRYEYDPDFYINYGVALRKRDDYTGAEQAFKKAIQLRSNDWQAWSNLANAYLKQNKLKDTVDCFEKAMKVKPPPPQQEKEAMLKDMADIARIMSMQAPPPARNSPALAQKSNSPSPGKKTRVSSAQGSAPTTTKESPSGTSKPESNGQEKGDLKKSGWDWVN